MIEPLYSPTQGAHSVFVVRRVTASCVRIAALRCIVSGYIISKHKWSYSMRKNASAKPMNFNLFEPVVPPSPPAATEVEDSSPPKIKDACPRCGGRSQQTTYPIDHNGCTRYCPQCPALDGDGCFYFTPEIPK
jgi:hypothetical protein